MNYAGFWRRFVAVFIDGLICVIPSLAMGYIIPYVGGIVLGLLYTPIFLASPLQATPGKALMGIAVVDENGNTITLKTSIIRYVSTILSGLILCIGYLMNLFTAKRQTLHDVLAGTVVIMKTAPNVNYFNIWLAEVKKIGGDQTVGQDISNFQQPQQSTTAFNENAAKAIEELHKLFKSGAITQAEYDLKKEELLKKI
jgi:uncharacterized RDD family membrane protein YckC